MPTPTFTDPPTTPTRGMVASVFNAAVAAFLGWFVTFRGELATGVTWIADQAATVASNTATAVAAAAGALISRDAAQVSANAAAASAAAASASSGNAAGFTATSTSSVTVGTGSKSFTVQASKSFQAGEFGKLVDQADAANYIFGPITSYNNGTGAVVMNVTHTGGSGTKTAWNFSLAGQPGAAGTGWVGGKLTSKIELTDRVTIAAAATVDIGGAASNNILVSGSGATITSLGTPGNGIEATVEFAGINTLANNSNIICLGGQALATAAGDVAEFVSNGSGWKMKSYAAAAAPPGGLRSGDVILSTNGAPGPGSVAMDNALLSNTTYAGLKSAIQNAYGQWGSAVQRTFTAPTNAGSGGLSKNRGRRSTCWTGDRLAIVQYAYDAAGTAYNALYTTTDGTSIAVPAGNSTGVSVGGGTSGAGNGYDTVVALGNQHIWTFETEGAGYNPRKSLDAWATAPSTVTLSSLPSGATLQTIRCAAGNRVSGKLMIGGSKGSSAPFVAAVNTTTGALTEKTLPAIAGAGAQPVSRLVNADGGATWLAFTVNVGQCWRSTDDGETWSVVSIPLALIVNLFEAVWLKDRFVIYNRATSMYPAAPQVAWSLDGLTWTALPSKPLLDKLGESLFALNFIAYVPTAGTFVMSGSTTPNGIALHLASADLLSLVRQSSNVLPTTGVNPVGVGKGLLYGGTFTGGANAASFDYLAHTHDVASQFRAPTAPDVHPLNAHVRA